MAGIQLIAEIEPKNSGSFALLDDKYMRGGLRVVETYDELESIPTDRLKDGCLAMVTTPSRVLYVYDQANDTWEPFSSGGGGGGSDWLCVEDGETTKLVKDVDTWTQKVVVINHIRTYTDYFALPTEYVQNNEVAYCKADVMEGTTTYKKGLYSYDAEKASWIEVNSTIEIDSALSDTSKRPVQNRVVTRALEEKVSKDDVDNVISRFSENPIQNKAVALALENIKPGKTMTAEEYDVLDDETKNDDSFYYISDTGEIYQNGIIYGGKQVFDVTQEEYDALTDEEKSNNEYHCTDTGRTYINGILYGDKKSIELTYEEYKQLEADGLVEPDVDYIIVGNESGVLLTSTDVAYDNEKTVKDKFDEVDETFNEYVTKNNFSKLNIKQFNDPGSNTSFKYVTITGLSAIGGIELNSAYAGKYMFSTPKSTPIYFGSGQYRGYTLNGYAWNGDGSVLYLKLAGFKPFSISVLGSVPDGTYNTQTIISDMTDIAPEGITFISTIDDNAIKADIMNLCGNRVMKTFDNTGSSTEKWCKICSALTTGIGCNIKLTASRADSTATVQYFSTVFRDSKYRYTSYYISKERTVYESELVAEYSAYIIADANNDIWVHVPSYGKAIIEIDTRVITIDGTVGTPVKDYVYSSFEHQYDGRINDTESSNLSTYSSSKINTELNKKLHTYSKQWYGNHDRYVKLGSIPISTGSVSVGSLLVTLFASSTKLEEYPVGTINLNISSGAAVNAFNINGFSTIALNTPRTDNIYTPRIVVDKTSTHYVLYIDCSYNYLKITCSILNSTNFTFCDFETASALEGTEVWSSVTSDDIKYLGSLKTNSNTNLTTITFDETYAVATSGGHGCTYMVRNGICYVNMDVRIKTNGQICTLPNPVQTVVNIPMTVFMHNLTGEVEAVNNGVLIIRSDGTATTLGALGNESRYMINFSYPIK